MLKEGSDASELTNSCLAFIASGEFTGSESNSASRVFPFNVTVLQMCWKSDSLPKTSDRRRKDVLYP